MQSAQTLVSIALRNEDHAAVSQKISHIYKQVHRPILENVRLWMHKPVTDSGSEFTDVDKTLDSFHAMLTFGNYLTKGYHCHFNGLDISLDPYLVQVWEISVDQCRQWPQIPGAEAEGLQFICNFW